MINLAVLFGGRSIEHEISVITGLQAILALDPQKYHILPVYCAMNGKWYTGGSLFEKSFYKKLPSAYEQLTEITLLPDPTIGGFKELKTNRIHPVDRCLLCFHGQYGEDGCVQGLLELADLPYTGSRVLSSALTMSKSHTKLLLKASGIPCLPHVLAKKEEAIKDFSAVRNNILAKLEYPLFIKPNHLGSSIGVAKASDKESLEQALAKVFLYDSRAIVEPYIENLLEINVSILEGDPPRPSVVEIPIASKDALSYEDKYLKGGSKSSGGSSQGMAGLTRIIDPSDLDQNIKQNVINYALKAFEELDCSGICRFDFMLDTSTESLYFNEVNPIPGSLSFYLWDHAKPRLLYSELLDILIEHSERKNALLSTLKRDFGFLALK